MHGAGNGHAHILAPVGLLFVFSPNIISLRQKSLFQHFFWHFFPLHNHGWCCLMWNRHCFQAPGLSQQQHTAKRWIYPANNSSSSYSCTLPALLVLLIRKKGNYPPCLAVWRWNTSLAHTTMLLLSTYNDSMCFCVHPLFQFKLQTTQKCIFKLGTDEMRQKGEKKW